MLTITFQLYLNTEFHLNSNILDIFLTNYYNTNNEILSIEREMHCGSINWAGMEERSGSEPTGFELEPVKNKFSLSLETG